VEVAATGALVVLGGLVMLGFAGFAVISMREDERRAAALASLFSLVGSMPLFVIAFSVPLAIKLVVLGIAAAAVAAGVMLFLWPMGDVQRLNDTPVERFDERDIMFARIRLKPNSREYASYYERRPENKVPDDQLRKLPGLMSLQAQKANLWAFTSAAASFSLTGAVREEVTGNVARVIRKRPPGAMSEYIKDLARYYGAHSVGITDLRPYHVYSHVGRGTGTYGERIDLRHSYAIAFTVEMAYEMMGPAPEASVVMESARQYVEAAKVALQLCYMIGHLGYPARAHIDGNYRVIAPLVARDAGLGEIGRMGLLMTPELGPRVRLGVVTTNLELFPDERMDGRAMLDFCTICLKCAENCPSRSIPFGERQQMKGANRWRIDAETCFRYWNVVGTDCGRCVTVCPYSHPDNLAHNLVRWSVERSGAARRLMLGLDDLFYGRNPAPRPLPSWIPRTKVAAD
jgi:ferredoxin